MNYTKRTFIRRIAWCTGLLAGSHVAPALAAAGCTQANLATYQIGQTTYVDVYNALLENQLVRDGEATGEGKLLLRCEAGEAMFRGRWQNQQTGDLLPLTVGGKPSGFGIKLFLKDDRDITRSFPHDFTRQFAAGEEVRSDDDKVRYEIYRMTGPVEFGRVDAGPIAQSNVTRAGGGLVVFRSMEIYSLIFRRPSCSITTESLNQTVDVGTYNASNFATPERATPWREFRLTVKECLEPIGLVAKFVFGSSADADAVDPTLFSLSGPEAPENVGLEIGDDDHLAFEPGKERRINAVGTGKDYVFNVRLKETRPTVRGGRFSRPVTVLVEFI